LEDLVYYLIGCGTFALAVWLLYWRAYLSGQSGSEGARAGCLATLLPRYDELSLFLMSVAFLTLYATDETLRTESSQQLFSAAGPIVVFLLIFFVAGIIFSIHHAFSDRAKSEPEKLLMLFFGMAANYAAGIAAGVYLIREAGGWLLIFPWMNILYAAVPMVAGGLTLVDETYVRDDDASRHEILAGLFFLTALLALCQLVFHLYWAVTFSICVAYAMGLSRIIQRASGVVLFVKQHQEE